MRWELNLDSYRGPGQTDTGPGKLTAKSMVYSSVDSDGGVGTDARNRGGQTRLKHMTTGFQAMFENALQAALWLGMPCAGILNCHIGWQAGSPQSRCPGPRGGGRPTAASPSEPEQHSPAEHNPLSRETAMT